MFVIELAFVGILKGVGAYASKETSEVGEVETEIGETVDVEVKESDTAKTVTEAITNAVSEVVNEVATLEDSNDNGEEISETEKESIFTEEELRKLRKLFIKDARDMYSGMMRLANEGVLSTSTSASAAVSNDRIVKFKSPVTDEVFNINITKIRDAWENAEPWDWDIFECHQAVAAEKEFLINQMNVAPNIACGMMGNFSNEGVFGMSQGDHKIFKSLEDAKAKLVDSSVRKGYGIVQWTDKSRRALLYKYYAKADKLEDLDFTSKMLIAELVCMYEEVIAYNLFDYSDTSISVEDACGRVAREYEGYGGSSSEWHKSNGHYSLVKSSGSGPRRLKYAKKFKELLEQGW